MKHKLSVSLLTLGAILMMATLSSLSQAVTVSLTVDWTHNDPHETTIHMTNTVT